MSAMIAKWVKTSTATENGGIIYPLAVLPLSSGEVGSPKVGPRTKGGPPCRDYTVLDFGEMVWQKGTYEAMDSLTGGVGESPQRTTVKVLELL